VLIVVDEKSKIYKGTKHQQKHYGKVCKGASRIVNKELVAA